MFLMLSIRNRERGAESHLGMVAHSIRTIGSRLSVVGSVGSPGTKGQHA